MVRHDLLGDKMLIKTISERGDGYDRPSQYDELFMDLKVYQKAEDREDSTEVVFSEHTDAELLMTDADVVTPVVKRIL